MRRMQVLNQCSQRGARPRRLGAGALGAVLAAALMASACSTAPANATPEATGSGVTVYGTVDAGVSRTRR